MITVRISFEKKNEASYISLLDLQRVMQRVLKRSGLPVWHTLGFNPHIYMTFACPLSLGQESECECVDVKTEAENPDFAQWQTELNAIMPTGIRITHVGPVQMKADLIAFACYQITYPAAAAAVLEQYNALESAPVEKHSKKGQKDRGAQGSHPAGGIYHRRGSCLHGALPACRTGAEPESLAAHRLSGRKVRSACRQRRHPAQALSDGGSAALYLISRAKNAFWAEQKIFGIILGKSLDFTGVLCYPIRALVSADTTAGLMTISLNGRSSDGKVPCMNV